MKKIRHGNMGKEFKKKKKKEQLGFSKEVHGKWELKGNLKGEEKKMKR